MTRIPRTPAAAATLAWMLTTAVSSGWLVSAAETSPAADAVVDALALRLARDGVRAPRTVTDAALAAACAGGRAFACAVAPTADGAAPPLGPAATTACAAGDPGACVVQAWTMLPGGAASLDLLASDPVTDAGGFDAGTFRALVQRACEGGSARGCIELGATEWLGLGTYRNLGGARRWWQPACERGDGLACGLLGDASRDRYWLDKGTALNHPVAWAALARDPKLRSEAEKRACAGGHTGACVAVGIDALAGDAASRDTARKLFTDACTLGDPDACLRATLVAAEDGAISAADAAAALDPLCASLPSACEEATFLRAGAPPVAHYRSTGVEPGELSAFVHGVKERLEACNLALLARDPHAEGEFPVVIRVDGDGTVLATFIRDPFDAELAVCVDKALVGLHTRPTLGGTAARNEMRFTAYHGADVLLFPADGSDGRFGIEAIRADLEAWRGPLDDCVLTHDAPEPDVWMRVGFTALPDGGFRDLRIVTSSETQALDACVTSWIAGRKMLVRPRFASAFEAQINFLARIEESSAQAPVTAMPPAAAGPGGRAKVAILVAARAMVDGAWGKTSRTTRDAVADAADALAAHVAEVTGGALTLDVDVIDVAADVGAMSRVDGADGAWWYSVPPEELPPEVLEAVPPGAYSALILVAPIPKGMPEPPTAHTWPTTMVRGATASLLAVRGDRALSGPPGAPPFTRLLDPLWAQVDTRTRVGMELGVDWMPIRNEPLRVAGHRLDPRGWGDYPSHTVLAWYDAVLAQMVPTFWQDVWTLGDRGTPDPTNLAATAIPTGEDVFDIEGLTDGVRDQRGFGPIARADFESSEPWFGLVFREPVPIGRVVALVGSIDDRDAPSFAGAVLEIDARGRGAWTAVGAEPVADGATMTWSFPPVPAAAMRIRVTDRSLAPVIRELEVYGR